MTVAEAWEAVNRRVKAMGAVGTVVDPDAVVFDAREQPESASLIVAGTGIDFQEASSMAGGLVWQYMYAVTETERDLEPQRLLVGLLIQMMVAGYEIGANQCS